MQSIAIIGTGIAGMGAGYFLRNDFDITFYEKNNYPGGHTNTITIDEDGAPIHIDSAFMVYNEVTYPNLIQLFKELDVPTFPTDMSFSVQHKPSGLDFSGTGYNGLFAQRKNIFNIPYIKMLLEIARFNKEAVEVLTQQQYFDYSLQRYLNEKGYSEDFLQKFLVPMSSAVWSTPPDLMLEFPVVTLVRFFKNHMFLGLQGHHQWRTVQGGSRVYRDKILALFKNKVFLNNPAKKIIRENGKATVVDSQNQKKIFDKVIIAAHANEALALLENPTLQEKELLSKFQYQKNKTTLHTDSSVMPATKRAWSSWNYRIGRDRKGDLRTSTIYYMNSLQNVSKKKDYFVSINDFGEIDSKRILWEADYDHPLFDVAAQRAQLELPSLNRNGVVYFCGSYFRYGFHEDALMSSKNVAELIR